jgi:hypothetical protein
MSKAAIGRRGGTLLTAAGAVGVILALSSIAVYAQVLPGALPESQQRFHAASGLPMRQPATCHSLR